MTALKEIDRLKWILDYLGNLKDKEIKEIILQPYGSGERLSVLVFTKGDDEGYKRLDDEKKQR